MPLNKDGSVHHVAPEDGSAIDKIWTCRLSGRTEMSFADALDSETNLQKILQLDFAAEWEKASLQRIHHSRLEISRLAERCVQTLEDSRIELGETVYYEPKKVLENTPKKNEKENSVVRYDLVRIEDNVEVSAVPRSKLSRLIPIPGLELMKIFIRAHSHRYKYEPDMPWVVDEPYLSMHKIEAKLDMDQIWMAKKEGKLILPPAPTENKKRKRSDAPKEPKAKKAKPDKKETKSIPVKTPKKNKKQPTLFDHFQKGVTSKPKNGESSPEYAPKLLDLVDLAKSLEAERNSSDEYWETAGKIATTTCMWSATQRDELFEKTSCAQTLRDDIFGRIQIKKLTQSSRGMKFRLKGMRPLPIFSPIQTVFDEEFTNLINSTDLNPRNSVCSKDVKSIILILCDFVLQFDLSDIRDRLHGLSEDKMTGYHYHKYVSKFVVDLLNGEDDASNLFWTELYLEHIYKKPSESTKNSRKIAYNGFQLGSHVITKLPQPCLPYLAGWHDCHTPRERSDLIFQVIESCLDYTGMEEMFADWRTTPLGSDRNGHLYWMFYFSSFVFIEDISSQSWSCLTNMEDFCRLVSRLDERHVAEYTLKKEFQEQREEIQAQFENFETLSTQALLAPPRRTTRRQAENAELPKMSIKESLVHEVKSITDKLWMGQLADIDDGDVLQSRIDSIANGSLASLKEIMIQIINSVPNSNLNDHLWNGKEKFVYLEKFNGEQDVAGFCIFWAIFDRKIKWEKFEKRKIEVLPSRASTRRRAAVKYTYDDNSQDSRYDDDGNMSSEDDQLIDDEELMKKLSRLPTRTSARLRNQT